MLVGALDDFAVYRFRSQLLPSGAALDQKFQFVALVEATYLARRVARTRRGNDWTNRFRKIAADAWHLNVKSAIIDGEVIVPSAHGVSDFSVLQNELRGKSNKLVLYAFDLLYLNGFDLRRGFLTARKALLRDLIKSSDILLSESFSIDGAEMFKSACKMGLEGVVSKVQDASYHSGRTNDWVKVTCRQRETLPIAGFALKEKRFDGIYLGRQKGKSMRLGRSTRGETSSKP